MGTLRPRPQQFETLRSEFRGIERHAGDIAFRSVRARNYSLLNRIATDRKCDRDRRGCCLGRKGCRCKTRVDYRDLSANQVEGHRRQSVEYAVGRMIFDVSTLDKAGGLQPWTKQRRIHFVRAG
jgi:hypothetical protein